jgi:hypothetical protein
MTFRARRIAATLLTIALGASVALGAATPANAVSAYTAPQEVVGAPVVPEEAVEYRGQLFFSGYSLDAWPSGKLYSFDGASFTLIDSMYTEVTNLQVINDVLYFCAKAAGAWFVVAYDGTNLTQTGIESNFTSIEFIGYDTGIMALLQSGANDYALQYLVDGSVRDLATYAYAHGLTNFGGLAYFVSTPTGGSDYQMDRTDGVLVEADVTEPGANMFVWKGVMYMGTIGQNWTFTKVLTDLTTAPASDPVIELAYHFTDAGDVMYFTGVRGDVENVYSYDGAAATELPAGLDVVGDLRMFDGQLFATSLSANPGVCGVEANGGCESDVSDVYYFDGTSWVLTASARNSLGGLIEFQNRLYFQDGAKWMFIERAALADTGLAHSSGLALGALLIALGLAAVLWRRRNRAGVTG